MPLDVTTILAFTVDEFREMYPNFSSDQPVGVVRMYSRYDGLLFRFQHFPVWPVFRDNAVVLDLTAETLVCESRA